MRPLRNALFSSLVFAFAAAGCAAFVLAWGGTTPGFGWEQAPLCAALAGFFTSFVAW